MHSIEKAIHELKDGSFIMIHDDKKREDEVDMVIAAEHVKPHHIASMRNQAGGLICLAVTNEITSRLGLMYMIDILRSMTHLNSMFSRIASSRSPYGDFPSFSISINHRDTFTGITDIDRALTISRMAEVCRNIDSGGVDEFAKSFRAPGHIPILIASNSLLAERIGHTELSIYLMHLAKLVPAVVICEMLDSTTHKALSVHKAEDYAKESGIVLLEAEQILRSYSKVA